YPGVRRWEESDDIVQDSMIRLQRCFAKESINSPAHYFRLAARSISQAVIDLARRYYGPLGLGANHATPNGDGLVRPEVAAGTDRDDPADLVLVIELHELIDELPAEVREVVRFHVILGMTLTEVADALGLSLSTVKRRRAEGQLRLSERLDPGPTPDAP